MNKAELISLMAKSANISKAQATKALESMLDATVDALKKGERVTLINFGTFSVAQRKARTGRNPLTNQAISIPAKKVARFKPGKVLVKATDSTGPRKATDSTGPKIKK